MSNRICVAGPAWQALHDHLLDTPVEQAAIMYARADRAADGVVFAAGEIELLQPDDFAFQSDFHISLTDEAQARIIKKAWDSGTAIVEFHSHIDASRSPRFSPSDLSGFREFVPHVWWRLRGQPYAAVVVATHGFDALVWRTDPRAPESLSAVEVDGAEYQPSGRTIAGLGGGS